MRGHDTHALKPTTYPAFVRHLLLAKLALQVRSGGLDCHKSAFRAPASSCMRKEVAIVNKLGLRARPGSEFVRCVLRFKSKITICKGEKNFAAHSILEVLGANLKGGDRVVLEAVGPDEQ